MFVAFEWVNTHFGSMVVLTFLLQNNKVQGLISLFVGAYFEIHRFIDGVERAHG
jgi:hypothetical protein